MDANNPFMSLPGITPEELTLLQKSTARLNVEQQQYFFNIYSAKRKNPEDIKLYCIASIVVPGLQRFMLGQTDWAILYFFTGGLFFVMTVIDLMDYQKLTLEYNEDVAYDCFTMTEMAGQYKV